MFDGGIPAAPPDEGVAAHYGDPIREQRALASDAALVDRSNRGVLRITGADRLSWLHSLTSQDLQKLTPGQTEQALILSPNGHVEHHMVLTDSGEAVWLHVEPGTAAALAAYLDSMRFMLRVEVADLSETHAVLTVAGPGAAGHAERVNGVADAGTMCSFWADLIMERGRIAEAAGKLALPLAGMQAFEAARIEARLPRLGVDTDHRTLPHEAGWIGTAVHLNKGCYRGQETVARIHNLGHPPRRLIFLDLDGSADRLPSRGAPITTDDGTEVGFAGSSAIHYELGPIGLGMVKRGTPVDAPLLADGVAARQEVIVAPDAGGVAADVVRRSGLRRSNLAGRNKELRREEPRAVLRRTLLAISDSQQTRRRVMSYPRTRHVVNRFVAGESSSDAVRAARELRAEGLLVTLDYLGEDTTDAAQAQAVTREYIDLLGKLGAEGLTAGGAVEVSVKPTAVGLYLAADGEQVAAGNIERIAAAARDVGTTVTVDAEDHVAVEATHRIVTGLRATFGSLGSVVQAMLRRTEADCRELAGQGTRIRLCKGAYNEPEPEAYNRRHDIDRSYARCLRVLMQGPGYPMVASHDPRLIQIAGSMALQAGRSGSDFEYQMLYGIRPDEQLRLASTGAQVRVYVPYGNDWYGYLVRRLAERPANLAFFLRSLSSRS